MSDVRYSCLIDTDLIKIYYIDMPQLWAFLHLVIERILEKEISLSFWLYKTDDFMRIKDVFKHMWFIKKSHHGFSVFVQIPGNLIEVAADPAVLGCQLPDSGKQLVIDRRHMDNRAYGRPPYRLPEKFGLADTIGRKPRCEVGILIFGQPGFHNAAAVGRVVFLSHGVNLICTQKR